MPCNWSTTASLLFRRSYYPWTSLRAAKSHVTYHNVQQGCSLWRAPSTHSQLYLPTRHGARNSITSQLSYPIQNYTRAYSGGAALASAPSVRIPPQPSISSTLVSTTSQLSASQVSRAAAQAVRLCIKEGGFGDALYVVNSACYSILRDPLQPPGKEGSVSQLQPISFGRPVSPRLAAHAFLHGLVRGGYARKAQIYAKLMIEAGIPIRTNTLETIITSTLSRPSTLFKLGPFARLTPKKRVDITSATLKLQTGLVSERCARAALELLQTARTFGQQRTERMYRVLVETLLMQGEIIVASLLFVILLQDWELRKLQEGVSQELAKGHITYDHLGVAPPHPSKLSDTPYPDMRIMGKILETVKQSFAGLSDNEGAKSRLPYLQSLALFAMLLDTGQLHTHRVAVVINALYKCPKTNARVWILRDGQMVQVEAYQYFHDVLKRLIDSLSGQDPSQPPLDMSRRSYNSLLSYSLRHRFSPTMASQILQHMCVDRTPPLSPDIVTFNILLRSGTVLRKLSISEAVLTALRLGSEEFKIEDSPFRKPALDTNEARSSTSDTTTDEAPDPVPADDMPHSDFLGAKARLSREVFTVPNELLAPVLTTGTPLQPSIYTLTTFITHLTSTGRPDAIAAVLFDILPELNVIVADHPATNGSANLHSTLSYKCALRQAVTRGPYVYAAMINALVKAGEIGLAERVFILAQQAAIASSNPNFVKHGSPWRLSVHAFTSLMQGYARLALGNLPAYKREREYVGTTLLARDARWQPRARHYDAGYAQYVYAMREESAAAARRHTKRQTSRRNATLLYRAMMTGARSILARFISRSPTTVDSARVRTRRAGTIWWWRTKPDARFFNAALELFGAASHAERSRQRPSRFWHRRLRRAARRFEQTGEVETDKWTPMLHKIAQAMVAHGFNVPVAYRHLLVGKWQVPMTAKRKRKMVIHAPYSFPPPTVHKRQWTHSLPTVKTRGLPVRRRWRRRTSDGCVGKPVS
ncbi:hypothetical protein LXA43DRAFT_1038592 [Ganoderma leucocontextum]|nr:hypothetical protein LXA43DRAFT_1038592 [Ganoderma leucocontextum]